jgi:hypothetical protein
MEEIKTIQISNFRLNIFRKLLEQSLIVDNQLMLEFSDTIIRACSFSSTRSFMKLWSTPIDNLLNNESKTDVIELDIVPKEKLSFPVFNFYILKGDLFHKYLSVHNTDMVDLEFILHKVDNKYQAANIIISGKSENNSPLVTTFILTTEELISNIITDYSLIINECTPQIDMVEFILTDIQIQEIKRLIKKLHKSTANNTAFLTFTIDVKENKIIVNDKVFTLSFQLIQKLQITENIVFNILKSDFIMTGNHTFSIFTNENDQKVILGAKFAGSIIWCLSSKVNENTINIDDSAMEYAISSEDLSEYLS